MGKKSKEETAQRVEAEKSKKDKKDKKEKKEKKEPKEEKEEIKPKKEVADSEMKNEDEDNWVPDESNMTAFQLKDRKQKTCFVGNLPLEATAKQLRSLFSKHGKVEKVWFRSVATVMDSKLPQKAKIIKKEYSDQKASKNA